MTNVDHTKLSFRNDAGQTTLKLLQSAVLERIINKVISKRKQAAACLDLNPLYNIKKLLQSNEIKMCYYFEQNKQNYSHP